MKIYSIALAVFVFTSMCVVFEEIGLFGDIYSHTPEQSYDIDETELDDIKQISGESLLSDKDLDEINSNKGGFWANVPIVGKLIKILDMSINIDKLILSFTPPSAHDTVEPLAGFFASCTRLLYAVGLISFIWKFKVEG